MKFLDAFKVNKAPVSEDESGVYYDEECYTESYMIRSDKTGRLCRWIVKHEDGKTESLFGFYGVRKSSKSPHESLRRVLSKMTREERKGFYRASFPIFEKASDAAEWFFRFNSSSNRKNASAATKAVMFTKFEQEAFWDLSAKSFDS